MHRNKSVDVHQFAMVPKAEIPRSKFVKQHTHKTTFDAGMLVPVYVDEVLPGDTFSLSMTAFARMSTPIFPIMDNLYLDSFFFFVPNRLVWSHWVKFMGEQDNPADSIVFSIPTVASPTGGFAANSVYDYFGLPMSGQVAGGSSVAVNVLPLRGYNLIYNQWFRDENLQNSSVFGNSGTVGDFGDGPDLNTNYVLLPRGKRHDYFTSCLPWTQKGGVAVTIPLGTLAPIKVNSSALVTGIQANSMGITVSSSGAAPVVSTAMGVGSAGQFGMTTTAATGVGVGIYPNNLYADLTAATAATINQLRQSFQIQRLLERDARSGSRYTEIVRAHFGVVSPDSRLQRSEFLGGGTTPINVNPIAQTSATGLTGGSSPQGNLAAIGTILAQGHGFTQSFTEHGHIIGLVSIRADLTYQQGLRKMWQRSTRYDFYFPVFANLGEQAVLTSEIYVQGTAADLVVFGYQERWAEYRYMPSMITGQFRSTYATPLDTWHLAEKFAAPPVLNAAFIQVNTAIPMARILATGSIGKQFIFDSFFDVKTARAMPLYSVPGLIDHF